MFSTRNAVKPKEEKSSALPPTSRYAIMQEERRQAKKAREEAKELENHQAQQPSKINVQEPQQHPTAPPQQSHSRSPQRSTRQSPPSRSSERAMLPPRQRRRSRSSGRSMPPQQRSRSRSRQRDQTPAEEFRPTATHSSSNSQTRHSSSRDRSVTLYYAPSDSESPSSHAPLQRLRHHQGSPSQSDEPNSAKATRHDNRRSRSPSRESSSREHWHAPPVSETAPHQSKYRRRIPSDDEAERQEPSKKRQKNRK